MLSHAIPDSPKSLPNLSQPLPTFFQNPLETNPEASKSPSRGDATDFELELAFKFKISFKKSRQRLAQDAPGRLQPLPKLPQ